MVTAGSSEILVAVYQIAQRHIPEEYLFFAWNMIAFLVTIAIYIEVERPYA
jgi:hypothetical protein